MRRAAPAIPLVASGGLRNGMDLAKAIALGADLGAMARPFLLRAEEGEDALRSFVQDILDELRICMFATGSARVTELRGKLRGADGPRARPTVERRMRRTLVLDVVGLTPALLAARAEPACAGRRAAGCAR